MPAMSASIASPPNLSAGLWLFAQASGSLNSLLNVDTPAKFFVVIALIVCVAAVAITIVVQLSMLSIHRAELEFKRDLVERGLSIDDIERLIAAKPVGKSKTSRV